jgi:hypothetical protein
VGLQGRSEARNLDLSSEQGWSWGEIPMKPKKKCKGDLRQCKSLMYATKTPQKKEIPIVKWLALLVQNTIQYISNIF